MSHNDLHEWVLRTVGSHGSPMTDIIHSFTVDYPDRDPNQLHELFEAQKELVVDEQGRVTLSPEWQKLHDQLEHVGDHEWSRRAKDAG